MPNPVRIAERTNRFTTLSRKSAKKALISPLLAHLYLDSVIERIFEKVCSTYAHRIEPSMLWLSSFKVRTAG